MPSNTDTLVNNWLQEMKIPVSKTYIRHQLLSHPDYPSLLSITDTLDELGIENTAVQIEKNKLHEMPVPFLAHLNGGGGEFAIIKNRDNLEKQFPNFFQRWGGVSIAAEKPGNLKHKENTVWLTKDKKQIEAVTLTFILLSAFIISANLISINWLQAGLFIVAVAGIFVSWMIVTKELGIENKIADSVCGKDADCDTVINSKTIKLPLNIGWSDAGIIYFSFLLIALLISSYTAAGSGLYILLALFILPAIPVTLLSVYYQWRVVKKWCRLCLITAALLWIQFFVLLPQTLSLTQTGLANISFSDILLSGFLLFITAAAWLWLKPLLKGNKKLETENFAGKRFKYNADVFMALLEKQRKVDTTAFENDLQLGNPTAPLQIMVACNPYCGPCAKAHEVLHELVERNDIGLTVRFTIKTENKEDEKLQAVTYIHQLTNGKEPGYKRMVLHHWNKLMNIEKFKEKYQEKKINDNYSDIGISGTENGSPSFGGVGQALLQQEKWSGESKITFTPNIFINGYELPKQYNVNDLTGLIRGVVEKYKNEIDASEQIKLQPQY